MLLPCRARNSLEPLGRQERTWFDFVSLGIFCFCGFSVCYAVRAVPGALWPGYIVWLIFWKSSFISLLTSWPLRSWWPLRGNEFTRYKLKGQNSDLHILKPFNLSLSAFSRLINQRFCFFACVLQFFSFKKGGNVQDSGILSREGHGDFAQWF